MCVENTLQVSQSQTLRSHDFGPRLSLFAGVGSAVHAATRRTLARPRSPFRQHDKCDADREPDQCGCEKANVKHKCVHFSTPASASGNTMRAIY